MPRRIAAVSLLVDDYDRAINWFTRVLRFRLDEDTPLADGKRWVRVSAAGGTPSLLLARAVGERQRAAIGDQCGGRVFLFLETGDFAADHARMRDAGVAFLEEPRRESYGTVAVFADFWGNRWDLIEPPSPA